MSKSDKQIVKECNGLARDFYSAMGDKTPDNYKMYAVTHPQEILCWQLAVMAFEQIAKTDVEDALANIT